VVDPFLAPIVERLAAVDGVVAVALGGSRARGAHRPDSDYDLGLYYREAAPFAITDIQRLAADVNDQPDPIVTDFGRWGRWVNGGAWLTVQGRRVDLLYRGLDDIGRVIDACRRGVRESDFYQQPPYGFHSYVYLGEVSVCRALHDPEAVLARLKSRIDPYPQPLKKAIVDRFLWAADFDLAQARKFARHGDVYSAAGCFTRVASHLVQVVFALNESYFITDSGALKEIGEFALQPSQFAATVERVLARPGENAGELSDAASRLAALVDRLRDLCGALYSRPDFRASATRSGA
jgi:hypothetical protein